MLFAIKSCERDEHNGFNQSVRDTWGKEVGDDTLRFFVGGDVVSPNLDVVTLGCRDDYDGLPWKTKEICRWVIENTSFGGAFFCDSDTLLIPSWVHNRIEHHGWPDYYGRIWRDYRVGLTFENMRDARNVLIPKCYPWASGGVGYFLSRTAMHFVIAEQVDHWAEDLWVGQIMGRLAEKGSVRVVSDIGLDGGGSLHCNVKPPEGYSPRWLRTHYHNTKQSGRIM